MLRLSIRLVVSLILILVIALTGLGWYTQTEHFRVWLREQGRLAVLASVHSETGR